MSGLLQRLAGQALGAKGGAPKEARVRPAMSAHAQVPMGIAGDEMAVPLEFPGLTPADETPLMPAKRTTEPRSEQMHASTQGSPIIAGQIESIVEVRAEKPPISTSRAFAASPSGKPEFARPHESAPPPRLLDEVQAAPLPPAIAPVREAPWFPLRSEQSTTSAEPTEVHVHIGRIEVTAEQEPAPAKRRVPARHQTLPLSDYLSRRRPS